MKTEILNFKGFTDDLTFKYLLSNKETLKDIINAFFEHVGIKKRFETTSIAPESYIMPNNKKGRGYVGDIIATFNSEEILSIEMYKDTFDKEKWNKSFCYAARLYDNQIKDKIKYKDVKKVYSINFIKGNFRRKNPDIINAYTFENVVTKEKIDDGNIEIFLIRFDLMHNMPYNVEEDRFTKWLRIISAKTLEEARVIGKDDEIMENSIKAMESWLADHSGQKAFDEWIEQKVVMAEEKALERGLKNGLEQGLEQGTINTIKDFLKIGISIENVMKATGLTKEQIDNLK